MVKMVRHRRSLVKRMIKMRVVIISIVIVIYLWSVTVRKASMIMISPEEDIQRDAIDLPQNDAERYISMDGFNGSPTSTFIPLGDCECELVSIDCLDAVKCLGSGNPLRKVHAGIVMRETIKQRAKYWSSSLITKGRGAAIGMASQEVAILVWKEWLSTNELPKGILNEAEPFVKGVRYPFCRENNLEGRACFISRFGADEEYGDDLEKPALQQFHANSKEDKIAAENQLRALQSNPYNVSTIDYLTAFAQVSRITFNLRSQVIDAIYQKRLETIDHNKDATSETFRVAMHVRRGDACTHRSKKYSVDPSRFHSPGQATGYRLCYENLVYIDALRRIIKMLPDRHIVVYLSTDHSLPLMDEIKTTFPDVYSAVSWKYLTYPPSLFSSDDTGLIGEASLMGIFHLSHGQTFVGHLGSRFGKMSWWQATARHHTFVPFFSVDGHSVCCEIDEPCGAMAPFIVSMESCLSMFWPETKYFGKLNQEEYWKKGLLIRREAARDEREFREMHTPKYGLSSLSREEIVAPDMELNERAEEASAEPEVGNTRGENVEEKSDTEAKSKEAEPSPDQERGNVEGNSAEEEINHTRNENAEVESETEAKSKETEPSPDQEQENVEENSEPEEAEFVGSPGSTFFQEGDCECDLVSIDCIDWIDCLPTNPSERTYSGIVTRRAIQKIANFWDFPLGDIFHHSPIGMGTQAVTTEVWRKWLSKNEIPSGLVNEPCNFVNETLYPYCKEKGLVGKNCFVNEFASSEEYGDIEQEAVEKHGSDDQNQEEFKIEQLRDLQRDPFNATTIDYLLAFAHVSRITFNLRAHVHDIYKQRVKTVDHRGETSGKEFPVALHIRRGDACGHDKSGYSQDISSLDSPAQSSGKRLCYQTGVYMDAILRVIKKVEDRHVVVYLASDHSLSLMDEIKTLFPDIYESASWKYVDYSRGIFDYFGANMEAGTFIESPDNPNKAVLGETAAVDIWHLSHGKVFIGNLGSRFGKLSWIQSTARHNSFVPFFTVDGHSVCCEIDESCGTIAKFIPSMENCLAIFWPQSKYNVDANKDEYWEKGSTIRMEAAHAERQYRQDKRNEADGSYTKTIQNIPPHEFAGSPTSTVIEYEDCRCDLVSIDCLDSLRCLSTNSLKQIYAGVVTRKVVKQLATHRDEPMGYSLAGSPIGMASQFVAAAVWKEWLTKNEFAKGLEIDTDDFVNETLYSYCRENDLLGRNCFINDFGADEEHDDLELDAISKYQITQINEERLATSRLQALQSDPLNATSLDFLLAYAHISRLTFNLRAHVHAIYQDHVKTINHDSNQTDVPAFRVAMHFRRGDACRHETSGYEQTASPLDSPAQFSMERKCYDTSVYMAALQRVVDLLPNQHIIVYVSTDHSGSLMEEIKNEFGEMYRSLSWKYLDYSRDIFDYFGGKHDDGAYIESPRNKNKAQLGETAITDLLHLSFGNAFIGHLGSRFGKLGWLQATARYNSFIPFYTVDGHSVCCDIDEACGLNAKFIVSMENCIATFWPKTRYSENLDLDEYFVSGAYFRRDAAKDEIKWREAGGRREIGSDPPDEIDVGDERDSFLGSPSSTEITSNDCSCQLVSIDCLDAIRCMAADSSEQIHTGVITRSMIKQLAAISKEEIPDSMQHAPIGKASQFLAIKVWRDWLSSNTIPKGLPNLPDAFLNETRYQYCQDNDLRGRGCFIDHFDAEETHGSLERAAMKSFQGNRSESEMDAKEHLQSLQSDPSDVSSLDYLLMHAQISRISFNLRPHVQDLYEQHLTTIDHSSAQAKNGVLRVAMHFRRGDACRHEKTGYETKASDLYSIAQVGGERLCYETSVYMNALRRIVAMSDGKDVIVHLATDDSGSLIEEIKEQYADLFKAVSWKYLEYSREIFNYVPGNVSDVTFIESPENANRGILGETAILDIWHLSFGQVFVGHLGSRFGKLSWIQATGRYNSFIPFYTVDGHSVCCDIDEACGKMSEYIVSMENCFSIYWPESKYADNLDQDEYFFHGAYFRKAAAKEELEFRKRQEENPFRNFDKFIGSPSATAIGNDDCQCELVSIDCLDAVRCLGSDTMEQIHTGVVIRSMVKQLASIANDPMGDVMPDAPVGKASQFLAIKLWRKWLEKNEMPKGLVNAPDAFLNHSMYSYCQENGLQGRGCFIDDFGANERYGDLERQAVNAFKGNRSAEEAKAKMRLESLQSDPFNVTALDYLLMHAQVSRISLNLRPHVHGLYDQHAKTINHNVNSTSVLRVAMHLRRGDACRHETTGYERTASVLDSPAQFAGDRLCYDTSVYLAALKRIQKLAPDRHIIVHVATDHSGSLMEEIEANHTTVYKSVSWKYLEYSRGIFDYFGGKDDGGTFIESPENQQRAILGETGLLDIWHLSFGQVFIGHLGSRFGKFSYIQATGRYNAFVPFYTVDGHSICCDIDEACGTHAKEVVSMENCVGMYWPESKWGEKQDTKIYWKSGAYFRKEAARDELRFRAKRNVTAM